MTWVTTEFERWHRRALQFASHHASTRSNPPKIRTECERRLLRWVLYCISLARSPADIDSEMLQAFLAQAHVRNTGVLFGPEMRSAYGRVIKEWGQWCARQGWPAS